ncbi:MAG: DUF934 domain-containing protein, partial [Gammaproteobacteria bacterium]|nr:DUF934 domain-containing protein [Gammaproteobacteria bacterium]
MNKIIKDGELVTPEYEIFESGEAKGSIVPLETFLALTDKSNTGVWIDAHEEVETIAAFVQDIPVVALNFPVFADGRAYSSANILRRVCGYTGEIRAM